MDLGLANRKALVCASSQGLGKACAVALAREGALVTINGRDAARLHAAATEIFDLTGHRPHTIVADVTTTEGRAALLRACPEPDILVTNNAGPSPGNPAHWTREIWITALEGNMLAAILLIQSVVPGMQRRGFGRVVNITSAMVKAPQLPMALSAAARSGLTAFCKALSREIAADNVTINNLLPERFDTPRLQVMTEHLAQRKQRSNEEARQLMVRSIPARRFGRPEELGDACAFLCAAQAGYISGQNLQLDGAAYPGLI
jgi:3-oxoacyl-[acyl-carrier protein] reductase